MPDIVGLYLDGAEKESAQTSAYHYAEPNFCWLNDEEFLFGGGMIFNVATGAAKALPPPGESEQQDRSFSVPNPAGDKIACLGISNGSSERTLSLYIYDVGSQNWSEAVTDVHRIISTENFIDLFWPDDDHLYYQSFYDDTDDGLLDYTREIIQYDLAKGEKYSWGKNVVIAEISTTQRYVTLDSYQDGEAIRSASPIVWDFIANQAVLRLQPGEISCYLDGENVLAYLEAGGTLTTYDLAHREVLAAVDIGEWLRDIGYKRLYSRQGQIFIEIGGNYYRVVI
jgi:hypothetical protein